MNNDEKAIREVIQQWMAESKAGHAANVLALMTDDVEFLTLSQPPFGKAEFAKSLSAMKGVTFDGKSDVQAIDVSGDLAVVRANLTVDATLPDGKEMHRAGPVLSVFRRGADGKWRLARDANFVK